MANVAGWWVCRVDLFCENLHIARCAQTWAQKRERDELTVAWILFWGLVIGEFSWEFIEIANKKTNSAILLY